MDNMTTTEFAATIRQTLKKQYGITSRQVSVKADHFSMGSAIRVRIKDMNISSKLVEGVAKQAESIRRCEYSGEILSGGNRYVTVSYDWDTLKTIADRWMDAVRVAVVALKAEPTYLHTIPGTTCQLGASNHGIQFGFTVWGTERYVAECCSIEAVAETIGVHMNNVVVGQ